MNIGSGYCLFRCDDFKGEVPALWDDKGRPRVYVTCEEAQRELVYILRHRLKQYLDGKLGFEDATQFDEFIKDVDVYPDGTIADADGVEFTPRSV